jgi:hypothetical protein
LLFEEGLKFMAVDPIAGIIAGVLTAIFTPIIMVILHSRRRKLKMNNETNEIVMENIGGRILFYLMMILWGFWTFLIIETIIGNIEYSNVGPISYFVITFLTMMAYLYGYGFTIHYNGEDIVKKSVLTGEKRYSVKEISEIVIWQYVSEPGPSAKIKFNNGTKLRLHYWYTGFDYLITELKRKTPDFVWKDKRKHGGVRW